jgi:hypothetical protein
MLLFALPALALLLLAFQLALPRLKIAREVFHGPVILIARDQSPSFLDGSFLKLGAAYRAFRDSLHSHYLPSGFKIKELLFKEDVQLVSGSFKTDTGAGPDFLTSFKALESYVNDSLPFKNIQALFLFSDGRDNLSPQKSEALEFSIPVYPVLFAPDSFRDVQLNAVTLLEESAPGKDPFQLSVNWTPFGVPKDAPTFSLVHGGTTLYKAGLKQPEKDQRTGSGREEIIRVSKKIWQKAAGSKHVHGVLHSGSANANAYNDTILLEEIASSHLPKIWFLKSLSSVDEHWMIRILSESGEFAVATARLKDLTGKKEVSRQQVWVHVKSFRKNKDRIMQLLKRKCRVVIYGEDRKGILTHFGLPREKFIRFGGRSQIYIPSENQAYFQNMRLSLASISDRNLWIPGFDSSLSCIVTVEKGNDRGCLLSKAEMDPVVFYRLAFSHFWKKLFHPSEPYTIKEQIKSLIQGTAEMVHRERTGLVVKIPEQIYENLPFELSLRLHRAASLKKPVLSFQRESRTLEFPMESARLSTHEEFFKAENLRLEAGLYRARIISGEKTLWWDSVTVLPKRSLELKKVGFNTGELEALAVRSKGSVIKSEFNNGTISAELPELFPGRQKTAWRKNTRFTIL